MLGPAFRSVLAAAACVAFIEGNVAHAQSEAERGIGRTEGAGSQAQTEWSLHTALEGERRPFLCRERDSVNLIVEIMTRSFEIRDSDAAKAQRLLEIAGRLQGELCKRPAADDIVILRCGLAQRELPRAKISTIKVSAVIRAEPSKGEQPFFAWTYFDIASGKDNSADARSAASRWCGENQDGDEAIAPSSDVVLALQRRLYDLGMRVPHVNGQMTPETMQVLIDFQKWAGLPPTGQLTKNTLQKITVTTPPTAWVAFAFDGNGNFAADTGATRLGAETGATEKLQRVSRSPYKLSSVPESCIAIATTRYVDRRRRTTFTQAFTNAGPSPAAASENVLGYCEREKGGGNCEVQKAVCADGVDAQRFDPKGIPVNSRAPNLRFDPVDIPANAPKR
jgi:hypothetical protein